MLAALLMVPMLGSAGMIVDFSRAMQIRSDMQNAADMAALGAISEKSAGVLAAMTQAANGAVVLSEKDALQLFNGQIGSSVPDFPITVTISVTKTNASLKASVAYSTSIPTTFLRVIGKETIAISGKAEAAFETASFQDFYVLLDNTPSMGVGATPADVKKMVANTPDACAFACHIVKNGVEDKNSYYNLAKKLGVTTRIDVVAQATEALMTTVGDTRRYSNQFRMALYTFGEKAEDTKLLQVQSLTDDLDVAKTSAAKIKLMSIPEQGYDNDQQTNFDRALTQINAQILTVGNGLSSTTPEKVVLLVSDGVGDSNKPSTCTKKTTGGRCQEPIDTKFCKVLKDRNVRIAVLYTTYLPLPTNSWYNSWIAPFQTEIGSKMQECASPGLYFEVSPTEGISKAMNTLFLKAVRSPRLTS
ncbi:TadE/TadG family type IV pilus assembly protein [Pararhizobium sp.]|uniref:TadE/TadG family type IV pilus assembly protein n=1 Tax=Pararhizobium sp. TaxID=1977563 RepID=UPI00271AD792|nr:VWA domain-containing protein [Pararhizobium sp.]MDO9418948.1 VWA domain-containing protein [Pararhizobium sp.]